MARPLGAWRLGLGTGLLGAVAFAAVFAPALAPFDPWGIVATPLQPPGWPHLLGTDLLGRDVLSGLIWGARVSLVIGLVSTACSLAIGVAIGAPAGYFGDRADQALMRFTEFFQVIPSFLFAVLLVAILTPGVRSVVTAIALVIWPPVARLVRTEFLSLRQRDFVEAGRALGMSSTRLIVRQILPNALAPVIAVGSLMVATAILTEASLSFLGLADPNMISWGYMIGAARSAFRQAWWLSVFPGACLFLTVLAITLLAEGFGDRHNPALRAMGAGG